MGASVRPVSTPDDAEFQAWKASQTAPQAPVTHDDAEFQQWKAAQTKATTMASGRQAPSGLVPSAADGATFGLASKGTAALTAGIAALKEGVRHPTENLGPLAGQVYTQDLGALRAAQSQYHEAHPILDTAANVGGALLPIVFSGGLGSAGEAANLSRMARFGKTVVTGAKFGAANAAGHSDALEDGQGVAGLAHDIGKGALIGGAVGVASIPASAVAGKLVRASGLPGAVSAAAGKLAPLLPAGGLQRGAQAVSGALGQEGEAAQVIARRARMDEQGGFTPTPLHPSIPPMALDAAGPNVEGLAEGIAQKPGPGRAAIVQAVDTRAKQMRPAVTGAFDNATGTTAADGERLLQHLTDEQARIANTASVADAVAQDAKGAAPAALHTPHSAWQAETGEQHVNALGVLRQMHENGRAEMDDLFGQARAATATQPMQSPTLDAVHQTPVGRLAQSWAKAQMANRSRILPTVTETKMPAAMQQMLDQAKPQDAARLLEQFRATGATEDVTKEVANPEMLHYEKQYLAKLARMGVNDGAQGTLATQAQGALGAWGKIKAEMPPIWNKADDAAAAHFRLMDAFNAGRNIVRTQASPAGTARKALATSLDGVEQRIADASPEEQYAFRVGARSAVDDYLKTAPPAKVAAKLQDPTSDLSRRIAMATGDNAAPARMARRLEARPQQLLAPPPVPALADESQAAARGLDVLRTPTAPTSSAPGKSLAVLGRDAAQLAPLPRQSLQQGAAQAARGAWNGASGSTKSPGRVFDFNSPETAEQLRYAFPTPTAASDFQNAIAGWDKVQEQKSRLVDNSRTALRGNEGNSRDLIQPGSVLRSPKRVLASLIDALNHEYEAGTKQELDATIAKMLTSPDLQTVPHAMRAGVLRDRLIQALRLGTASVGADRATH